MNLIGKNIILRAIEERDCEFLRKMINDPETEKDVVGWSFPVSSAEQMTWFNNNCHSKNDIRLIIEHNEVAIGLVSITNIDWKNRKAENGIKLFGNNIKGKGFGTETIRLIMKYAFEELQLNRLYSTILFTNIPSQKLYKKCGWKIEGTLRKSVFKNNKYIDELQVGVLKADYEKIKKEWL